MEEADFGMVSTTDSSALSMMMEENVDECFQGLEFPETPVSRTVAAEDHKFHTINFCFSCDPVYIYMVRNEQYGRADFVDFEESPTVTKSIRVELQDFNNWGEVREKLDGLLGDYPISYQMRHKLMDVAVETATHILVSSGHRVLDLHIPFEINHEHVFEENNDMVNSDRVSTATDSTACLKSKVIISSCDDYGRCTICLEDFYQGCEGLCTPCSHVFHGDCIKTLLRTSRCCPLCRFELPTS